MVPLDVAAIGAAYYTGNCHKWLCGPKGSAFLHVRRDRQKEVRPLAISHGANSERTDRSPFRLEFDWTGTADPSAYLALPTAIRFMGSLLPGGWGELMATNRNLALAARDLLCQAFEVDPPAPDDMIGSMATVPLPGPAESSSLQDAWTIGEALFRSFGIEVPIIGMPAPLDANGEAGLARAGSLRSHLGAALQHARPVRPSRGCPGRDPGNRPFRPGPQIR